MKELWSKNKYINLSVNILMFLVAINFMHIGQLFLPIICLILFIDNKFKFKVKDLFSFTVLCLFAITFFLFSYKLGFYSVMGFTLPMAYYIGSNLFEPSKEKVKNLIYLIAFGMASHLILNFIFESVLLNFHIGYLFKKGSHYDLWVYIIRHGWTFEGETYRVLQVKPNSTASNYVFISSIFCYLKQCEKNKKIKIIGIILYIISSIYCVALARRASIVIFVLSILIPIFYRKFILKHKNKKNIKNFLLIVIVIAAFCLIYITNLFNVQKIINSTTIIRKIRNEGINSGRLEILIKSVKLYPDHIFGGQEISNIVGYQPHDLWGDIYDYAGIIPSMLIIIYSLKNLMKTIKKLFKEKNEKMMILLTWFICSTSNLFVEPIMTGNSLYLILYILILASINNLSFRISYTNNSFANKNLQSQ